LADDTTGDPTAERVADSVRRALSLVGPAENGVERLAEDPAEDAVSS
jgi:hypothetical protein